MAPLLKNFMNPQTIIAAIIMFGVMLTGYADVKTDIGVNEKGIENNEHQLKEKYEQIDRKLDKIIDRLLEDSNG